MKKDTLRPYPLTDTHLHGNPAPSQTPLAEGEMGRSLLDQERVILLECVLFSAGGEMGRPVCRARAGLRLNPNV